MKKLEMISSRQMTIVFLAFMTGSAIINIPSPIAGLAKNGAWISILMALSAGYILLACVLYLNKQYPGLTFIEYSRKAIGNWLTLLLAIPYLIFITMMVSFIVIDIGGFFTTAMLRETPSYAFHALILLTASLTARAGIEVMARMFPLLLFVMFGSTIIVLLFASPQFHPGNLLPVMPNGFKPILHGAFFLYGFPYGELVLMATLLPFVRQEKESALVKYMMYALLINGLSLLIVTVCTIMTFGPLSGELKFSVFMIARIINVQDFIERIESVIGLSLIAASYMKTTIALFVLNLSISHLLKLKDNRILFFPLTMICFLLTLTFFNNEVEFIDMVKMIWPLIGFFSGGLPIILITGVEITKNLFRKSGGNSTT
jgi:spore germination protein KB